MDFFNYKNLKKIFYLLAIISLLLTIKTRVFGATVETSDNVSYNVPDVIFDDYYFLAFRFPNSTDKRWYYVISETTCTIQFYYDSSFNAYIGQLNAQNNGQIRYHNVNSDLQRLLNLVQSTPRLYW